MLHWVCVCVCQGGWRFWWVYEYEETAGNASRPAETHRELEVENWAETASETEREERKEEDRQRKWAARRREITDSHIAGEIRLNIKSTRSPHWLLLNNTQEQSDGRGAPVILTRILSEGLPDSSTTSQTLHRLLKYRCFGGQNWRASLWRGLI